MLALATQHGSAYLAGNLIAVVLLAAGALWLGLRALDRRGRRADAAVVSFVPDPPPSTSASVGPPGFAEPASAFVPTPVRRVGRSSRDRTTDAIAALVCSVLLVGALVNFASRVGGGGDDFGDTAWDTPQGRVLHLSFVAGCEHAATPVPFDCECVFQRLTSAPPFDTPAGFANLPATMAQMRTAADVPSGLIAAGRDCMRG